MKAAAYHLKPIKDGAGLALIRFLATHQDFSGLLWHFTSAKKFTGIVESQLIHPSSGEGAHGQTTGAELGAVSLFDFSTLNHESLSLCEHQCASFLTREVTARMIAYRSMANIVSAAEAAARTDRGRRIPHAEVFHVGCISLKQSAGVFMFDWDASTLTKLRL